MEVVFSHTTYEGGWPQLGSAPIENTNLFVSNLGVSVSKGFKRGKLISMGSIRSFEVIGEQVAKSKVGAVVAFGVLGGLAAKGTKDQTTLIVHDILGHGGQFTIDKMSATHVRAKLAPVLRVASKPFTEMESPADRAMYEQGRAGPVPPGVADQPTPDLVPQLRELAKMRDDGILTEEEFAAAKAKLLRATRVDSADQHRPLTQPTSPIGSVPTIDPPRQYEASNARFASERANDMANRIIQLKAGMRQGEAQHLQTVAFVKSQRAFYKRNRALRSPSSKAMLEGQEPLLASQEELKKAALTLEAALLRSVEQMRELGDLSESEYAAMKALFRE